MTERYTVYQWVYEALWLLVALVITVAVTYDIYGSIRNDFFFFLAGVCFGSVTYIRWIIYPEHSPLMFSFWVKLLMFAVNFPLFLFVMRYFTVAMEVFDSFNFSYEDRQEQLIITGIPLTLFNYIKSLTILACSVMLISIILYQFRSIQLIFKWRQVPKSLTS